MTSDSTCERLVRDYIDELAESVTLRGLGNGCVITTPFLMPDGDFVEVEARFLPNGVVQLTDSGDTISFLWLNGLSLSRNILGDARRIARRYGVSLARNELVVEQKEQENPIHNLVQAILGISALIEKRRPHARINFAEEVEAAIIARGSNYDSPFLVRGQNESHSVRFHVNGGRRIIAQTLSQSSESAARGIAERSYYLFDDILRKEPSWRCFGLLDDRGNRKEFWTEHAMIPLRNKATVIGWSEGKEEFLQILTPLNS